MSTEPKQPIIQRNRFPQRACDLTKLPFVQDVKVGPRRTERKFWCVPEVDYYGEANAIGAQYAADWLQYLPTEWVARATGVVSLFGLLGKFVKQGGKK